MFDAASFYLFGFAAVTIAGGVMGFVKAGSRASIIAGSIAGALLVVAGVLAGGPNATIGLVLGLVISLALAARFGNAYRKTKKVMPAGLVAVLGLVGVVLTAMALARR